MRVYFIVLFLLVSLVSWGQTWPADTIKININSGDPKFPFPQFLEYKAGKTLAKYNAEGVTHADMEKAMREGYRIMMNRSVYTGKELKGVKYIVYNAGKPGFEFEIVPKNNNTFCSEGDGYALLAAAYFGDKITFDGLWLWIHDNRLNNVKKYYDCQSLRANYKHGDLPGWFSTENEIEYNSGSTGVNSATDGDYDIAMGLLLATKQWGNNMGLTDACGDSISYKKEALKMIKALVDTVYYTSNHSGDGVGTKGYLTGDVGIDGYCKNGVTWNEVTRWRGSVANLAYPWAKATPDPLTVGQNIYTDYLGPAYFHQFADYLKENDGTAWQISQLKRCEASSDWIMGKLFEKGYIPNSGNCFVSDDGSNITFGQHPIGPDGEDFRASWRTILNYVWHSDPDSSWNPITHQIIASPNSYEKNIGLKHAAFLKTPRINSLDNSPALCDKLGANPDLSCPLWKGVSQIRQGFNVDGTIGGGAGGPGRTNYNVGTGAVSAVASEDLDLTAELYRQCEIMWDDVSDEYKGFTEEQRNTKSTPIYFHDWFRLLGMLTTTGNLQAPSNMVNAPNLKVYMSVDKTFAYEKDLITYTINYRNYGSDAASGVSISTKLPSDYEFLSASNGGILSGNTINWNIATVPGFQSTTGILPTQGILKFTIRVKTITAAINVCISSTISLNGLEVWTSNEYPNNATYTMERNCVDLLKDRVLAIKKTTDKNAMNGGDIVNFNLQFENRSGSNLWLNGGRDRVVMSYGNYYRNEGTSFYQFYRIWHTAQEAYINLGNYRVSYFMNDPAAIGLYNAANNPTGWDTYVDNQNDLDKYGYNPLTLPKENQLRFTYERIPYGSNSEGSWNQRIITQFAKVLSAPSSHIYDKLDHENFIHKGVVGPGFTRTRFESKPSSILANRLADDWSYSSAVAATAGDPLSGQTDRFTPISPSYTNFKTKFAPVVVNNYSKDICNPDVPNFSKVLVEEFDGYTWRRIAGNGPLPGRETYNVVVTDSVPIELIFKEFTDTSALGVYATYTPLSGNARFSGVVRWAVPVMLTGEKGDFAYTAVAKPNTCPSADKPFVNAAWISSQVDSPDSSSVSLYISCTPVPPTPPKETSLKKTANKKFAKTGDQITYTLTFTNKDGSTGQWNGTSTDLSEWRAAGDAILPKLNNAVVSFNQNTTGNPSPGSVGYGFEHIKVHGKNGWVETTINPTNSSPISYFFRHTAGTPGQTGFKGLMLQLTPNDGGNNFMSLVLYQNSISISSFSGSSKLSYGGIPNPIKLKLELIDDKLYIWTNDFTGAPLKVISGITNFDAGYTGVFASGSQQNMSAWKGHFDSAFDLIVSDPVPSQLTSITNISPPITSSGQLLTWNRIAGPIPANEVVTYSFDAIVSTCTDYINNIAKASVYGNNNILSQFSITCGDAPLPPICQKPTSLTITPDLTTICTGDSIIPSAAYVLGSAPSNSYQYTWHREGTTPVAADYKPITGFTAPVLKSGNWILRIEDGGTNNPACYLQDTIKITTVPKPAKPNAGVDKEICSSDFPLEAARPASGTVKWSSDNAAVTFADNTVYNTLASKLPLNTPVLLILSVTDAVCKTPVSDTVKITSKGQLTAANVKYQSDTLCSNDLLPVFTGNTLKNGESGQWTSVTAGATITTDGKVSKLNTGLNKFVYSITGISCPGSTTDTVSVFVVPEPIASIISPTVGADKTYKTPAPSVTLQATAGPASNYNGVWNKTGQGSLSSTTTANTNLTGLTIPGTTKVLWIVSEPTKACKADTAYVLIVKLADNYAFAGYDTTICEASLPLVLRGTGSEAGTWKALSLQTVVTANGTTATINTASGTEINVYQYCISNNICDTINITLKTAETPVVTISPSPSAENCLGDSVRLGIETLTPGLSSEYSYQWIKNGTVIADQTSEIFTTNAWLDQDQYFLKIRAVNAAASCLKVDSAISNQIKLTAVQSVVPSVSIFADTSELNCEGDAVKIKIRNISGHGVNPEYSWFLNGLVSSSDSVLDLSNWTTGNIIKLSIKSSQSCAIPNTAESNTLILKGKPRADLTIDLEVEGIPAGGLICAGTGLALKASSSIPDLIYTWFDGTNTYPVQNFNQNVLTSVTFTVKAKSGAGCYLTGDSLQKEVSVPVQVADPVTVRVEYDASGKCKDSVQALSVNGTGQILSYRWFINDVLTEKDQEFEVFLNLKHHDIVKVEAVPVLSCTSEENKLTDTARVNVYKKPAQGFAGNTGTVFLCSGNTYKITSDESDPAYAYTWTLDGATVSLENSVIIQTPGRYYLKISNNSCTTESYITAKSGNPFVKIIPDQTDFSPGGVISAEASVSTENMSSVFTYAWTPLNILDMSDQKQVRVTPAESFWLKVFVTDQEGCFASDSIYLIKRDKLFIPNALTPGESGLNAFWGIKGAESFPDIDIMVFNRWGGMVHQQKGYSTPWDGTINGKELPSGTYYYVIKDSKIKDPLVGDVTIIR